MNLDILSRGSRQTDRLLTNSNSGNSQRKGKWNERYQETRTTGNKSVESPNFKANSPRSTSLILRND